MKQHKRFLSLTKRIMMATLIPVMLSLALIFSVIFLSLLGTLDRSAEAKLQQISQKFKHSFEDKVDDAMNYLSILSSELQLQSRTGNGDREALQALVWTIFDHYRLVDGSSVYFEADRFDGRDAQYVATQYGTAQTGRICWYFYKDNGHTAYLPEGMENEIEFTLPHYTLAKEKNAPIYTDPFVYQVDGVDISMFTLTHPIQDADGVFIGAVTVDLFLDDFYAQLQREEIYNTGYITIMNDNGTIVYSPIYEDIGKSPAETGRDYLRHDAEGGDTLGTTLSIVTGNEALFTTGVIYVEPLDSRFYVSVVAPRSEINAEIQWLLVLLVLFGAAVIAAITMLIHYLVGRMSAPLNEISQSVDKIAGGDYDTRIAGNYKGEFAVVKDSVNSMADSIESYTRVLDRRLGQQDLMASISQSFLSNENTRVLVKNALSKVGEFIGVAQVLFYRMSEDGITFVCRSGWNNPAFELSNHIDEEIRVSGAALELLQNMTRAQRCLSSDDARIQAAVAPYRLRFQRFLIAPIFVNDTLFGILDFSRDDDGDPWSDSDRNLAILTANLLSGAFARHSIELQLRQVSSIVESSPQFILYLTADGAVDYVNQAAERITGHSIDEMKAGGLEFMFGAQTAEEIRTRCIPNTLLNGTDDIEITLVCKDGRPRIMAFSTFTAGEHATNIGCIASDLTEIRALQGELISAKELAEQGSRAKSEFLSRMSHEMRTPMNAIIGMTNIAKSSHDAAKKEYCLDRIDDASRHLLGVINDILDMSKIEADKFELSEAEFHFERMLHSVLNVLNFRVEEKRQTLTVSIDPSVPDCIVGDAQRLSQVITNLLTNAVKFTPELGTISLSAALVGEADGLCTLQIEIVDSGIGISADQQKKLFQSFEQADGSIARKFGGTGLGLAICKRIVGLMGGDIWVESELGKGACFRFTFTARRGQDGDPADEAADKPSDAPARYAGKCVLLAEDVEINREILLTVLEDTQLDIHCAENGRQAVELFAAHPQQYSLIFMDIHMPEVDGLEATRRIRAMPTGAHIPIIAMTANVFQEDVDKCLAAGMNGHIGKPIHLDDLFQTLNRYLGA